MVIAGDADLAGDNQRHPRVRNSVAHTMGSLSTATMTLIAGEPERTEMTRTAKRQNAKRKLRATFKRVLNKKLRDIIQAGASN